MHFFTIKANVVFLVQTFYFMHHSASYWIHVTISSSSSFLCSWRLDMMNRKVNYFLMIFRAKIHGLLLKFTSHIFSVNIKLYTIIRISAHNVIICICISFFFTHFYMHSKKRFFLTNIYNTFSIFQYKNYLRTMVEANHHNKMNKTSIY